MLIVAARLRGTEGLASLGCSWGKLGIRGKITCLKMGGQRGVLTPISSVPALCFSLNKCTIVKKTLCACMKELCCAVGSPEVLVQPRDTAEGFYQAFFSRGLQWVEKPERSEFRLDCGRVLFTCGGKKKKSY